MDKIEIVASGYEWFCQHCKAFNTLIQVPKDHTAICEVCGFVFEIVSVTHTTEE